MRFIHIPGGPIEGLRFPLLQREIRAPEGVFGEVGVMSKALATDGDIIAVGIDQVHESEHGFGTKSPGPILFAQIAAGADADPVEVGRDRRVFVRVEQADLFA